MDDIKISYKIIMLEDSKMKIIIQKSVSKRMEWDRILIIVQ